MAAVYPQKRSGGQLLFNPHERNRKHQGRWPVAEINFGIVAQCFYPQNVRRLKGMKEIGEIEFHKKQDGVWLCNF